MENKKVLIIEDERVLQDALSRSFESEGYEFMEALTGNEGLDLALKIHPDLILLDLILPGMDGIQVLENLRNDAWGKTAKVIVITNLEEKESRAKAEQLDVLEYCLKSNMNVRVLLEKVHGFLS